MKERLRNSLLKIGGQHLKIVESPKSKTKKHKKAFTNVVNKLKDQHHRSGDLHREFGIDTAWYEDHHFQIIEQLIIEHYGVVLGPIKLFFCSNTFEVKITPILSVTLSSNVQSLEVLTLP